jgi:hypothetical protein
MEKQNGPEEDDCSRGLTMAMAAPALAQDPAARSPNVQHQRTERVYHHGSGFWAADVAAGVVGGAIGTAGAIATAPFRGDAYAYGDPYYGRPYYGAYQGFGCQPGTMFGARMGECTSADNRS